MSAVDDVGAAEARVLRAVVEASPDGVLVISPDRRVLAWNRNFCELWRRPEGAVRVGGPSPALTGVQAPLLVDPDGFEQAIRWGHEHPDKVQQLEIALTDGRVVEGTGAPVLDDVGGYVGRVWRMHDATAERRASALRAELTARLADAERSSRFLLAAADALARSSGFAGSLRALAEAAVPTLGDLCLIDVVAERGSVRRVAAVHADPSRRAAAARLEAFPPEPGGPHPAAVAMRSGRTTWASHMPEGLLATIARSDSHLALSSELDLDGYVAVPLLAGDVVLGAVTLLTTGSGRRLGPADVELAQELAGRVARVVAKERRYDQEHEAAHALQANLLPADTTAPAGFEVAVRYLPATRQAELGGDFYDLAALPGGGVALAVGDVEGHDMAAAAEMAQLRAAIRALRRAGGGPAGLLDALRAAWDDLGLVRLATVVVATVDPAGRVVLASAGHLAPLVVGRGGARVLDVPAGPPLGVPAGPATAAEITLPDEAALVCFTDGLVERRDRTLADGTAALVAATVDAATTEPQALADRALSVLDADDRDDDVALLVLRRAPAKTQTAAT